jgi:hypothetical protein
MWSVTFLSLLHNGTHCTLSLSVCFYIIMADTMDNTTLSGSPAVPMKPVQVKLVLLGKSANRYHREANAQKKPSWIFVMNCLVKHASANLNTTFLLAVVVVSDGET